MAPKLCECGCGLPAPIVKKNNREFGYVKGVPHRFIHTHYVALISKNACPLGEIPQCVRRRRSKAIKELARHVLAQSPMTIDAFLKIVQRHWPEMRRHNVSVLCSNAGFPYSSRSRKRTCGACGGRLQKGKRSPCAECRRDPSSPRTPLMQAPEMLGVAVRAANDEMLSLAFELACTISFKQSADIVGPLWVGIADGYANGRRDRDSLIAAAMAELRRDNRATRTYARSLDAIRERNGWEPTQKGVE